MEDRTQPTPKENAMLTPEKIEEWIKEVEERPASAAMILRFIANRLRELSERNEELLAENIALLTGKRVEEYERRITHLEYQLELLRRHAGGDLPSAEELAPAERPAAPSETTSLLAYDTQGRVLRLELPPQAQGRPPIHLQGEFPAEAEPPRLLAVTSSEELLFIFTSGRIATLPAASLPAAEAPDWESAPMPHAPNAGEKLACLAPLSRMGLAGFLVQTSRRGYAKKVNITLAESILANHYIGTGIRLPADVTFDLALCSKEDRLALVSWEGWLACLEVSGLPFSIEEAMRLGISDHLAAVFVIPPGQPLIAVTQIGKIIHRAAEGLDTVDLRARGQMLFSSARREQGVRVVGAACASEADWAAALHRDGSLSLHTVSELFGSGAIPTQSQVVAFAAFPAPAGGPNGS